MENVSSRCGKSDNAPRLRFPEFRGEWVEKKLREIIIEVKRKAEENSKAPVMMISATEGFINQSERYSSNNAGKSLKKYTLLKKGELAYNHGYSKTRNFGSCFTLEIEQARIPFVYHSFSLKGENDSVFWGKYLNSGLFDGKLRRLVASTARMDGLLNISFENYSSMPVNIPSLPEQKKIAAFFTLLDRRIQKQRQLVECLKTYKRGVIFSIFKKDNQFGIQIKKTPLSELLTEYRNRNTKNLMVCSVAVGKGVVNQIEHLGRSFAAADTSNYGKVKPGDIVYTKSPTGNFPYGIVKQSRQKQDVAVSPLYGVYTPKSFSAGTLIHNYFEQSENANNYIRPLAQKGAKNTINITTSYFLKGSIPFLESENDVEKFANFFNLLDEKIQQTENFLHNLSMQKKELLHRMFI